MKLSYHIKYPRKIKKQLKKRGEYYWVLNVSKWIRQSNELLEEHLRQEFCKSTQRSIEEAINRIYDSPPPHNGILTNNMNDLNKIQSI